MASSRTWLDVINEVLTFCSEPAITTVVPSVDAPLPIAVTTTIYALRQAYRDVQNAGMWAWCRIRKNFETWTTYTALVPDMHRFFNVQWKSPNGTYVQIPVIERDEFFLLYGEPVAYTNANTRPAVVAFAASDGTAYFSPYPGDTATRAQIFVDGLRERYSITFNDSSTFPCTDRFVDAIVAKACLHMANKYIHDSKLAYSCLKEYENIIHQLQSTQRDTSSNMRIR